MRDLLRLAAHIAGIALTISLIPLAAVLTVFVHPGWGTACLAATLAAVWLAARLDHRARGGPVVAGRPHIVGGGVLPELFVLHEQPRRDPVDGHFADVAQVLNEPTVPLHVAQRPAPRPPRALSGQDAAVKPDRLPFGMCYDGVHMPPQPWFNDLDTPRWPSNDEVHGA